jgi:hypothetical protein
MGFLQFHHRRRMITGDRPWRAILWEEAEARCESLRRVPIVYDFALLESGISLRRVRLKRFLYLASNVQVCRIRVFAEVNGE